ncbi:MAG: hypothetical protein HLUCCA11_07950 [Phormidesmis priestleyi Ana]|uniref:Uncharacterized protein n=1 Tax=Phormidesmis priestleyi Ana TaxID=1666911 RepID=A0A0P8BQ77_9CYAN|nr:MAG: hypothetical protein HLUCCA11_07950 [Phormidesmis priestleyi Ana]
MVVNGAFQNSQADNFTAQADSTASETMPIEFYLAQQQIYDDLLEAVRTLPAVEALAEFEATFFGPSNSLDADVSPFLYRILFADNEAEFRNTLKRACYIFVNNWDLARQGDMLHLLLELFEQPSLTKSTLSPSLKRLRNWLLNFANSKDFEELELFASQRTQNSRSSNWSFRYTTYQLIGQYIDENNSLEQREAARSLSRRIKDKYKHDLAMYTAFSQNSSRLNRKYANPTVLGDEVLRLIKAILVRRGQYSYHNVARLFQQQTHESSYSDYKESLIEYLCFSISDLAFLNVIEAGLNTKLPPLYQMHDRDAVDPSLNLRTCNRLIDFLITEDKNMPSMLFVRMLEQGNPLNIAVMLLKIVLISPNSQLYLEARLANLINYYKQFTEAECQGIIQLLEIFGVTFAIYSDNVEYNLVQVSDSSNGSATPSDDDFRIFSRSFRAAQKRAKLELEQRQLVKD